MLKFNYKYLLFTSFLISLSLTRAQVFTGDLLLKNQAEIDSFNYTSVTGLLTVQEETPGSITNLNGMSELKSVGYRFYISNNTALTDISGLSNLTDIGDDTGVLAIINNSALTNLNGLSGITFMQGNVQITSNQSLTDLSGLSNLTSVYTLTISDNPSLSNINGLSGLNTISYLFFYNNDNFTSLDGFTNVTSIKDVRIHANDNLVSINFLPNVPSIGLLEIQDNPSLKSFNSALTIPSINGIYLINNDALTNLNSLSNLQSAKGLVLIDNDSLTDLNGFANQDSLNELTIDNNSSLNDLTGLNNLHFIVMLTITNNAGLTNLNGLSGLYFASAVEIHSNPNLTNLDGLSNLSQIGDQLFITFNQSLTSFCGLYTLMLHFPDPAHQILDISNNASNPTREDILNGGPCSDQTKSFISVLNGETVKPPVETEASGGGMYILNTNRDTLQYWIRVCNFNCPLTSARFHIGINFEPPVKNITSSFTQDSAGNLYAHGIWTKNDPEPLTSVISDYLVQGVLYLNISSSVYPSGEVRGYLKNDMPVHLYANLDGAQEVPPVFTAAGGEGHFILSGDGDSLTYNVTAHNLSGPVSAAHFHKAPFGVPGPIVKPIMFSGDSLSEGVWANTDTQPLTPALVADLLGCYLYVNVHTPNNPSGEIRGQIYKTDEVQLDLMTMIAATNNINPDNNSLLSLYSLKEGKTFEQAEGEINGYNGKKNITSLSIDGGGNIYFVNNTWASILYLVKPRQIDFNAATPVRAKQVGKLRTYPDETLVKISRIHFINGKLYGIDNIAGKLYDINPYNGYVKEIFSLNTSASVLTGFSPAADGNVYLLKSEEDGRSQLWKFEGFPSATLSLVTSFDAPGNIETLSGHPNGNLYAAGKEVYELNLGNRTLGVLKDHPVNIAAMDFNYYNEKGKEAVPTVMFQPVTGLTDVKSFTSAPTEYKLNQNYPNPFNPSTIIRYSLAEAGLVKLNVYNMLGELVKTLVNRHLEAGEYQTIFDASGLPSGVYIYKLEAGNFSHSAKMILLK